MNWPGCRVSAARPCATATGTPTAYCACSAVRAPVSATTWCTSALIVDGPLGRLDGHLLHDSVPSLDNALDKMNRYTTGRAQDKLRHGGRGGLAKGAGACGLWAFVRSYGLKRGFLDGRLGLVLALHIAETTYYRYLKMWLAPRKRRRMNLLDQKRLP